MASNATVNRQVNIYINSGDAQKALDILLQKEKKLKEELSKATDPKKIAALNKELAKLAEPIDRATKKLKGELLPTFKDLELATRRWLNEFKRTGDPAALANFQKFNAELQKQKGLINNLESAQNGLTKKGIFSGAFWGSLAAGGIAAAVSAASNFLTGSIDEALEADRAIGRLKSTLDNLGRGDSFDRITSKAEEMADRFRFLDNDEVLGVFKKLIDFGKLTEKEMNDLLPVIIDFAANSRIGIEEASEVIIKALSGNGKALKEYGIDIKDAKTETERLNIVMTTLKDKVDGAADAFGNSMAGSIAASKQEFKDLQEELGNQLLPILNKILSFFVEASKGAKMLAKDIGLLFSGGFKAVQENFDKETTEAALKNIGQKFQGLTADQRLEERNQLQRANGELRKLLADLETGSLAKEGLGDQKRIEQVKKKIEFNKRLLDVLFQIQNVEGNDKPLGIKQPNSPDTKEADKKRQQELDAYKAFLKKINELNSDFDISQQEGFDKELAMLQKKIAGLNEEAAKFKDNKDLLLRIEELYRKESLALIDKYTKLDQQKFDAAAQEQAKKLAAGLQTQLEALTLIANTTDRDKAAKDQLAILNAEGDEKIKLQKEQIQKQADAEIEEEIKKLTKLGATRVNAEIMLQNVIALIRKKASEEQEKLETENIAKRIERILPFAQQAFDILNAIGDARTNKENAELEEDRRRNDKKKQNLDRQLKGKLVTQLQYDREVQKIEKEQEKREKETRLKQFKRNQRAQIIQTIMNGAMAITSTLAAIPGPLDILSLGAVRLVQLGLMAATTAAQVAIISKQKPPEFAKGGKLGGRSHAAGGNAVVDAGGRKIAEVEAGEGIINKKTMADRRNFTVSGTPSQIASSINSLYGVNWEAGARLVPNWTTSSPAVMNFSAMKRMYAEGGVFDNKTTTAEPQQINLAILQDLTMAVQELREQMKIPIKAYTRVTDHEEAQERIDNIRNDATIQG
jgi:hypothetical protein